MQLISINMHKMHMNDNKNYNTYYRYVSYVDWHFTEITNVKRPCRRSGRTKFKVQFDKNTVLIDK